ncbi:cation-translocating P-type ATPase [Thalassospira xiamenensis]|jgi:Ca2+-transporting ATPase|uniref:ATPase n=1 Tax=Thalassospira xiamenensis TaxID=220697 RepID=A0A367XFG4_9PROT|nr:cation-transporting P-type ATPase [Thalassospira xiamenensis]KZB56849.1 ATPase [Thalassospira xiamenensis]MCK2166802.1 cation-transporting P-type ATPase [Thalassospira xiamenensis]RCK52149.1 ATPase [Thalassospira xiamenensis]
MSDHHIQPLPEILAHLNVSPEVGLSETDATERRKKYGRNSLKDQKHVSFWNILIRQFAGLIVYMLAGAAALSFYFGDLTEGIAIVVVLIINAAIGFTSEFRAIRSMEALRKLSSVHAKVRRDGQIHVLEARDIVPGDIVIFEAGDVIPADIRLIECSNLQADESALTGESVPTDKIINLPDDARTDENLPLGDRTNMVFKGTAISRGDGSGVCVATGMTTELGHIAAMTEMAEAETSPLEKRLDTLAGHLIWATLGLTICIAIVGIYVGKDMVMMLKTGIALAIAAVPEGLPIVATVALARGMWRMAKRNALIKNLSAVETLGATTVIMTDKTGTLTENRMTVVALRTSENEVDFTSSPDALLAANSPEELAIRIAVLCNDAILLPSGSTEKHIGDPMELALLEVARNAGIDQTEQQARYPEIAKEAFSAQTRMMATFHRDQNTPDNLFVAIKGAPEAVIKNSTGFLENHGPREMDEKARRRWSDLSNDMTQKGLRVLALAMKNAPAVDTPPYQDLILIGLIALLDPPREDVPAAIQACHAAGVRVIMVTGDHIGTARNIAAQVGLCDATASGLEGRMLQATDLTQKTERDRILATPVFARVSPEAKLNLVSLHQQAGAIVAMTGDGVNDAPALKKADIGIAMGKRGTDVAREAADMVLRDDAFASIVTAMHQGRVIFANIRTFVLYLMSCNLSEILVIGLAVPSGLPLPLLPLQILYLNLVTDVFPAFALGIGEGDRHVMNQPPRDPKTPVLTKQDWGGIFFYGALITVGVLGAFAMALHVFNLGDQEALSVSFLTLATAQLLHVFNMRARSSGWIFNDVTRNPFIWIALGICVLLIGLTLYVPALSRLLMIAPPSGTGWLLVTGGSLVPLVIGQAAKIFTKPAKQPVSS